MMQYVYTNIFYQNHCLTVVPKSQGDIQSILDTYLKNFTSIAVESEKARERERECTVMRFLDLKETSTDMAADWIFKKFKLI